MVVLYMMLVNCTNFWYLDKKLPKQITNLFGGLKMEVAPSILNCVWVLCSVNEDMQTKLCFLLGLKQVLIFGEYLLRIWYSDSTQILIVLA